MMNRCFNPKDAFWPVINCHDEYKEEVKTEITAN